jgi:hypothetical protein
MIHVIRCRACWKDVQIIKGPKAKIESEIKSCPECGKSETYHHGTIHGSKKTGTSIVAESFTTLKDNRKHYLEKEEQGNDQNHSPQTK